MKGMVYILNRIIVLLIFFNIICLSTNAQKKIVIVTGTDYVEHITVEQLKLLYKGELKDLNGKPVSFLDHDRTSDLYVDFLNSFFGLTPEQMKEYWVNAKLNKGKNPPKFLPDNLLPKAVGTIKGSVSYYYEGEVPPNLKVVKIIQ